VGNDFVRPLYSNDLVKGFLPVPELCDLVIQLCAPSSRSVLTAASISDWSMIE
jgi:hypothetical protein